MNIYLFELKSSIKSAVSWFLSISILFLLLMAGMFPLYMDAAEDIKKVLENFPPAFTQTFGISIEGMFSFGGFYNFSFGYLGLLGGVMAATLGIHMFAKEKRAKCVDFLLSKPVSRRDVYMMKFLVSLTFVIGFNVLYELLLIITYQIKGDGTISLGRIVYAGLGMLLTQIIFLAMGILFAVVARKIRSVSGIATVFGISAFILSSLANVLDEKTLDLIAPLKYFEPERIFEGKNFELQFVIAAIIITIVCLGISFIKYEKNDIRQV